MKKANKKNSNKKIEEHAMPSIAITTGYLIIKNYTYLETKVEALDRLGYGVNNIAVICGVSIQKVKNILN